MFTFTSSEPLQGDGDAPVEDNKNQDSGEAQGPTDENIEVKEADNERQEEIPQPKVMKTEENGPKTKNDRQSKALINHKSENSLAYKNDTSMGKTFWILFS